eukprot:5104377-Pleurochrysis_carterae.AAC.2
MCIRDRYDEGAGGDRGRGRRECRDGGSAAAEGISEGKEGRGRRGREASEQMTNDEGAKEGGEKTKNDGEMKWRAGKTSLSNLDGKHGQR